MNPLQFDDPRDFERYPRDFSADAELLARPRAVRWSSAAPWSSSSPRLAAVRCRCAIGSGRAWARGRAPSGTLRRCGHHLRAAVRAGAPAARLLRRKDYQQCCVVTDLALQLGQPEIVVCPTSRDSDGLARSSRNRLLDASERSRALALSRALFSARMAWDSGERDPACGSRTDARHPCPRRDRDGVRGRARSSRLHELARGPLCRARALIAARVGRGAADRQPRPRWCPR